MDTTRNETGAPTPRADRVPDHERYRYVRRSVADLLARSRPVDDPVVPACPEWTIRGLLTHLVDVTAATVGNLSGRPAAYSSSSADMDIPALLAVWEELGAEVDLLLAAEGGSAGNLLVMDAFTHELDIRYAIGAESPSDHPAFAGAFAVLVKGFTRAVGKHGLPALRLSTGRTQWVIGTGEPAATLTATHIDLYRSLAGRRSHQQITALDWDRDPHRWLPAFTWGPFTPPVSPVEPTGFVQPTPAI